MSKNLSMKERASLATKVVGNSPAMTAPVTERKVHSGPGNSILAMLSDARVGDENKVLKEELRAWEGALPARKIDARLVEISRWSNRHDDSFKNADFKKLKADIELAGGNVQAIKVCPIPGSDPQRYEIVFGHRRHRACLELNMPVLALIEAVSEQELFVQMDRENRQRADLRPYEQGEMYRRALDHGLYPTVSSLAYAIGASPINISRAIKIARLSEEILDAFPSRLDIQYRWADPLSDAAAKHRDDLIAKANLIVIARKEGHPASAKEVVAQLLAVANKDPGTKDVVVDGEKVLKVKKMKNKVAFEIGLTSETNIKRIEEFIIKTLGK
jgi:ParB family chromosome partitioning protein